MTTSTIILSGDRDMTFEPRVCLPVLTTKESRKVHDGYNLSRRVLFIRIWFQYMSMDVLYMFTDSVEANVAYVDETRPKIIGMIIFLLICLSMLPMLDVWFSSAPKNVCHDGM